MATIDPMNDASAPLAWTAPRLIALTGTSSSEAGNLPSGGERSSTCAGQPYCFFPASAG